MRGLALVCIFFDHIPHNMISVLTLGRYGFCDAAEIFVLLAGFSAVLAYGAALERRGWPAVIGKVARRSVQIYATHVALVLATLLILVARTAFFSVQPLYTAPLLGDGFDGVWRAVTLKALPTYLDVLPLYMVLLATLPLVLGGLRRSPALLLLASVAIYLCANLLHFNLPNHIDKATASGWSFNPFTWQLVFVFGALMGFAQRGGKALFTTPPAFLRVLCGLYLLFAWLVVRWGDMTPSLQDAIATPLLGNEPKCFVTPWRLLHVLALAYLALTSRRFSAVARWPGFTPVVACGRHSLAVFATGCLLSLLGRIAFRHAGTDLAVQVFVNSVGLSLLLWAGTALERRSNRGAAPAEPKVSFVPVEA